ncbi:sulfurtransferase TusE [bacterium BMS3Bbin11]|nr:sulfurtransferase TusE [bacterium BMS3Abin11]GBE45346.1 sulfurtransferase TusE [bacterium BMS3Bbin11]GMT40958.1 MAG: sulfurtransferase TusE [bacterium]HDH15311.1 TusE/DsrC/DsvC family sulfur relay protein [Gammaproteobacteria bacterium]HDZ78411.1 TusE/DsrC/DsvC family sulfur relay protein [Gammaproteobacteria bacterium]
MDLPIVLDKEGYLINPEDWNEEVAEELAISEGITMNAEYWPVLGFMREYFFENGVAPDVRHTVEYLVKKNGYDKKEAKTYLFKLFPYGYVKQACKLAGMKRPRAWSTG